MGLKWLFLDMNSFFASCEQYDDPALRGRPVGVCPVLADGGMTIAASYEAKRCGVSMTRAAEARRLCPDITLLQARPARYVELHEAVKASIEKHLPITTTYSIDEWAVRLMGDERDPSHALALARRIKAQIAADFDGALPCSVGLAPSRLLAKTACECRKPDGLTVLTMDRMPGVLASMELRDIPGVGGGMDQRLRQNDVTTPAELWALSRADCRRIWGSVQGEYFWSGFHGVDPVEPTTHRRSMGHAHILPPKLRTEAGAYGILTRLLCKAIMRCRRDGYFAHRLRMHVSFENKTSWGDEIELPSVDDTPTALEHFERLWTRRPWAALPGEAAMTPKKVSVDLGGLTPSQSTPGHLFRQTDQPRKLSAVLDQVNRKFGAHKLHPGSMTHVVDYQMDDKIAFGRIPEQDIAM
ncbi:MAG: type VI secretion protein ImpB [Planctomycetota bacterium]